MNDDEVRRLLREAAARAHAAEDYSRPFQSKFAGFCPECGKPVAIGDAVVLPKAAARLLVPKRARHARCVGAL